MNINLKSFNYKPILISIAIILCFAAIVFTYFSPIFEGRELRQHDVLQYLGTANEALTFEKETGITPLWTNSMFSGMPTYLTHILTMNLVNYIYNAFYFYQTAIDHPEMIVLMYFVWAFLALLLVNVPIGLAGLGGLFYGFSTYFFIIIEAGHVTKAVALGYMPLIIASIYAVYWQRKLLLGTAVFTMAMALQLIANHLQITYYTAIICIVLVGFAISKSIKEKEFKRDFIKPSLYLLIGLILAVGADFSRFYSVYDYTRESIRGKSDLVSDDKQNQGLDKDYATTWSYGIDETLDLLVPNFKGGATASELDTDSETYKTLKQNGVPNAKSHIKSMPTYWGDQVFTSGPVYIGAIVIFLFVFGLIYVTGALKWWIVIITALSIMLAWGSNFMILTDFFLDYVPGYNRFRTVSMVLVIAEFAIPLMAVLALQKFFKDEDTAFSFKKLSIALGIVGGLLLFLIFTAGLWSYQGPHDAEMLPDWLLPALQADRKAMMLSDLWRSLLIVVATYVVLALFRFNKLKPTVAVILLAIIVTVDMYPVNKRYLNDTDFRKKSEYLFQPTRANRMILQDTDPNFRVMNLTVSPFNDASTSYFHKSIGGYHGAKLSRYQDLIDSCLSKQNWNVYNMLNTKYFIVNVDDNYPIAQIIEHAMGNAWFVKNLHIVPNANAELASIMAKDFTPAENAYVDKQFAVADTTFTVDSSATIKLNSYSPIELHYTSNNAQNGVAVFSEIYFKKGWNAYIDGNLTPHFRVNYVLRALEIPAGNHEIVFKFEPTLFHKTDVVSLIFSIILLISFFAAIGYEIYSALKKNNEEVA